MFRSLVFQHPLYMVKLLNEFHKKKKKISDHWIEHGKNFGKNKTRFFFPYRRKNSVRGAAAVLHLLCLQECLSAMFAWTCICLQTILLREWLLQLDMWWTNPSITLFRQSCKVQDLHSPKRSRRPHISQRQKLSCQVPYVALEASQHILHLPLIVISGKDNQLRL